jgi:hypothetical protein
MHTESSLQCPKAMLLPILPACLLGMSLNIVQEQVWRNPLQFKSEFCPVLEGISMHKKERGRPALFAFGSRSAKKGLCSCKDHFQQDMKI